MLPLRRLLALATTLLVVLVASACTGVQGTDGKTWITGEGSIDTVAPADRGKVVEASGEDLDGSDLDLADYRGKVVVLNVYGSWCPPCRKEMPTVVQLAQAADPAQVQFIGINIRDNPSSAQSFGRKYGIDFPSFDDPSSAILLALSEKIGPYSLPSTVVLDREGRLAALVLGEIPGARTMQEIIDDVVAESG